MSATDDDNTNCYGTGLRVIGAKSDPPLPAPTPDRAPGEGERMTAEHRAAEAERRAGEAERDRPRVLAENRLFLQERANQEQTAANLRESLSKEMGRRDRMWAALKKVAAFCRHTIAAERNDWNALGDRYDAAQKRAEELAVVLREARKTAEELILAVAGLQLVADMGSDDLTRAAYVQRTVQAGLAADACRRLFVEIDRAIGAGAAGESGKGAGT